MARNRDTDYDLLFDALHRIVESYRDNENVRITDDMYSDNLRAVDKEALDSAYVLVDDITAGTPVKQDAAKDSHWEGGCGGFRVPMTILSSNKS